MLICLNINICVCFGNKLSVNESVWFVRVRFVNFEFIELTKVSNCTELSGSS